MKLTKNYNKIRIDKDYKIKIATIIIRSEMMMKIQQVTNKMH